MYSTIPQLMYEKAQEIPGADLQFYKDKTGVFLGVKYGDFSELMLDFAAVLFRSGRGRLSISD